MFAAVKQVPELRQITHMTGSNFLLLNTFYKDTQAEAKRTTALPAISAAPAAYSVAAGSSSAAAPAAPAASLVAADSSGAATLPAPAASTVAA